MNSIKINPKDKLSVGIMAGSVYVKDAHNHIISGRLNTIGGLLQELIGNEDETRQGSLCDSYPAAFVDNGSDNWRVMHTRMSGKEARIVMRLLAKAVQEHEDN